MFNYLGFIHAGVSAPGASPDADGKQLAESCIRQLLETGNPEQFPPRLLILLLSPAYDDAELARQIAGSIRRALTEYKRTSSCFDQNEPEEVPLIGSSTAAVFFDRQIHDRGALLVCLASRLITAKVEAGRLAGADPEEAIDDLLKRMRLGVYGSGANIDRPLTDRLLLTFFPGAGRHDEASAFMAPDLHRILRQKVYTRTPIIGGVTTRPGFQLIDDKVCQGEMVVARIFTGSPFASSIGHGLSETGSFLRIKHLAPDHRTIIEFDQPGAPVEVLNLRETGQTSLFGELTLNRDPLINVAWPASDGISVTLLRNARENSLLAQLEPGNPQHERRELKRLFHHSLLRWTLEKPVGCFAIHCASRHRAGLDFDGIAEDAEQLMEGAGYFGGFFEGEAGIDETGRFLFGNWSVATLCFGDEMRDRTPAYTGFKAISETAPALIGVTSLEEALQGSLKVIFDTGLPGAMISLAMQNMDGDWIVAREAVGARFKKIVPMTKRQIHKGDILSLIASDVTRTPVFIPDSALDPRCDSDAVKESGIVSQYLLPLYDRRQMLIAIMQFDLADLRRRNHRLHKSEERILQSLGAMVGATLLRVLNRMEADLARDLDQALMESLRADTLEEALQTFIEHATHIFGVRMGHIRLLKTEEEEETLEMAAGVGGYYEAFKLLRRKTPVQSDSPTALAFRQDQAVVVNDSEKDGWWGVALRYYRDNPQAYAAMSQVRGYANAPIRDGEGNRIGTISLLSADSWFFLRPRVRALDALSRRVGVLLDQFNLQKERKFLLEISSDFVRNADFTQPIATINDTIVRLRKAANADIASLFIWDKEAERFVLRAQDGWAEPEWVDAARYKKGERWTGRVALKSAPIHIPDLLAYKQEHIVGADRDYETRVFGHHLSESFNVEAIGLPLVRRGKPIGVLTLFRRLDSKQPRGESGFTTTDPNILQQAADTISAMLSALLYNLRINWLEKERNRHEKVRNVLETGDDSTPIEQRLCQQMTQSFYVKCATLYLTISDDRQMGLRWAAGADRYDGPISTPKEPDETILRAAMQRTIQERKRDLSENEWRIPDVAKTEGLLNRVSLPLLNEDRLVGVLDLQFSAMRLKSPLVTLHDPDQLMQLAGKIALVYEQQKEISEKAEAELKAEKGKLAVQAMGAMVFQTAHRLMNLTQSIKSLSILIESASTDEDRKSKFSELYKLVNSASDGIKRPMEIARHMKDVRPQLFNLLPLILEAKLESDFNAYPRARNIRVDIPEGLTVLADYGLIREAFRNIIHNAMKAMPGEGSLTVTGAVSDDRRSVRVNFADTGVGMTEAQIHAAMSGFVTTQSGTGLGVLVSLLLLRAQNGNLEIKSCVGAGTTVIVTLPTIQKELAT